MAPASRTTSSASKNKKSASKKKTAAASSAKKATKKAPAKKAAAKKSKKATKKAPAKKVAAKKATKKAPAKKATKKAPAKKAVAKKAPSKKAAANKAGATKKTSDDKKNQKTELPSYLTDKAWLKSQRDLLMEERRKYTHSAASLVAEAQALMADREPGDVQFDEESGEGDTLAVERDRDLALSGKALENVAEIDAALARLADGSYGICVSSGEFIPQERLEAIPWASKTVAAQTSIF